MFLLELIASVFEDFLEPIIVWIGEIIERIYTKAPLWCRIFSRILLASGGIVFVGFLLYLAYQSNRWRIILLCSVVIILIILGFGWISRKYKDKL